MADHESDQMPLVCPSRYCTTAIRVSTVLFKLSGVTMVPYLGGRESIPQIPQLNNRRRVVLRSRGQLCGFSWVPHQSTASRLFVRVAEGEEWSLGTQIPNRGDAVESRGSQNIVYFLVPLDASDIALRSHLGAWSVRFGRRGVGHIPDEQLQQHSGVSRKMSTSLLHFAIYLSVGTTRHEKVGLVRVEVQRLDWPAVFLCRRQKRGRLTLPTNHEKVNGEEPANRAKSNRSGGEGLKRGSTCVPS